MIQMYHNLDERGYKLKTDAASHSVCTKGVIKVNSIINVDVVYLRCIKVCEDL